MASCPHPASMSSPRLRRTVAVTSALARVRIKRFRRSSLALFKATPATLLYMITFTFEGAHRTMLISLRRSEEHTSELQSRGHLVCRLLLEKKNKEDEV